MTRTTFAVLLIVCGCNDTENAPRFENAESDWIALKQTFAEGTVKEIKESCTANGVERLEFSMTQNEIGNDQTILKNARLFGEIAARSDSIIEKTGEVSHVKVTFPIDKGMYYPSAFHLKWSDGQWKFDGYSPPE